MKEKGRGSVIVLGGMIGVGKSSYTKLISEHLGSEAFYESVEDNRLLEQFYAEPSRYAFALQIYFLNTRFRDIKKAMRHRNNCLDRSIYEDALFASLNAQEYVGKVTGKVYTPNMSAAEYDCYIDLLDNMLEEVENLEDTPKKRPDLFVYLRASFETIEKRIAQRGRSFEQFRDNPELEDYMRELHSRYDDWVFNHYNKSDVLIIDADRLDISRPEDAAEVLRLVDEALENLERKTIVYK